MTIIYIHADQINGEIVKDDINVFTLISFVQNLSKEDIKDIKIKQICCGVQHSGCVFGKDTICLWGSGDSLKYETPKFFKPNKDSKFKWKVVHDFCIGHNFCVIRTDEGDIYTAGSNRYGELGNNNISSNKVKEQKNTVFEKINLTDSVWKVGVGYSHVVAICKSNNSRKVYGWGNNKHGQLIYPSMEKIPSPKKLDILTDLNPFDIACGGYHCALITFNENYRKNQYNAIKCVPQNRTLNTHNIQSQLQIIQASLEEQENLNKEIKDQENKFFFLLEKNFDSKLSVFFIFFVVYF